MIFKKKKYQRHFIAIFALFIYMSMVFAFTVSQVMQRGQQWRQVLNSSITVELPLSKDIQDSIKVIRGVAGVKVVKAMDEDKKQEVLSQWLDGVDVSKMPIADIIEVRLATDIDLDSVKTELEETIKGSKVYSNMDWGQDIFDMTQAIFYMCIFLFSLIVVVAIVLINFMIKSLLNGYAKEIDILHLNGASDVFISAMLQKNIFTQALKAGFIGVLFAHITWFVLSKFFNINYIFGSSQIINGVLIVLLVAVISSVFVKFNVEKELRL
jgi:cell division protein FtsX